jgi:hypothetical protein
VIGFPKLPRRQREREVRDWFSETSSSSSGVKSFLMRDLKRENVNARSERKREVRDLKRENSIAAGDQMYLSFAAAQT